MTLEDIILKYKSRLRISIIIGLLFSFFSVIIGAFYELNHPDTEFAKQLLYLSNITIGFTIFFALPLFYLKVKSIESWNAEHEDDTGEDKRKAIWEIAKPFLKEAMIAVIVFIIVMFLFNYFNLIPQETVDSYKQYYLNKRIFG